jgi:hypothetical protein
VEQEPDFPKQERVPKWDIAEDRENLQENLLEIAKVFHRSAFLAMPKMELSIGPQNPCIAGIC